MDTKTTIELAQFIKAHSDDYSIIVCMRKREDAEGSTIAMSGEPHVMMGLMSQQIASFYRRYNESFKEGVSINKVCADLAIGADIAYKDMTSGESECTDMSGFMGGF